MNTLCRYSLKMVKESVVNEAIESAYIQRGADAAALLNKAVDLSSRPQEEVWVIYLNVKSQVIGIEMISKGAISSSTAMPADVFRGAILKGAFAIIMVHNHPSGDPTPSKLDIEAAERLIKVGDILSVKLVDSIVVAGDTFISMRENVRELSFM